VRCPHVRVQRHLRVPWRILSIWRSGTLTSDLINLKIYQKARDLAVVVFPATDRFPRPQQYGGLASELRQITLDLLKTIASVNESHSRLLHETIDVDLQQIWLMVDLAADLKYITPDLRDGMRLQIDEIGRMNGGWMKMA